MIRMIQSSSADQAKAYFSDALQRSDYYINDQELQGQFFGRLADRIGLEQVATKDNFFALCENINPKTGKALTPRNRENRRVGYDINFHVPKSVSILNSLTNDSHIIEAFQASVYKTMKDIERDSMTRVRKKGTYEDRISGELIWAEFIHQTARPVDGSVPDPHLHAHCFVINAAWDDEEKLIKAGEFGNIKTSMPYFQSRFHKNLSDKLIDLGYQIRRTDKSFEVVGVPQSVIDLFSKRTNEIGEFAKEKGITDAKQLSELGARTRSKKQKGLSMDELKKEWRKQINECANYKDGEQDMPVRHAPKMEPSKIIADDCLNFALKHSFERASVMPERRILATAYRHSIGSRLVSLDEITNKFNNDKEIIRVKEKHLTYCTNREVLREEKQMVELARQGQGNFRPLYQQAPDIKLTGQQGNALIHILTTHNQVSIVRGVAGSGKTTLLKEAAGLIENTGKQIVIVAPSADASRVVLKNEGFENADTVARLLIDKEFQKELSNNVLIVDEAGLLGTKDMTSLLSLSVKYNTRLILVGDTRQHTSVVRGDALRILNTIGGIKTAEVSKIYRQRNVHYRAAVEDLSKGDVKAAFIKLSSIGAIKNIDPLKPNEALVADFIDTVRRNKSALIVSPTHKQGEAVTNEIRGKLRSAGIIGKKELSATKLNNINLTEAEKSDWRNFEKGQIIQFNQNVTKISRGSIWSITEISEEGVKMIDPRGTVRWLPRDMSNTFEVFRKSQIGLSKGDKIKITRGSFDNQKKRLNNGQALEVVAINKSGKIELINRASKVSYVLNKDFGHLDHAYCSGRDAVTIYTDDRVALLEHAAEIGDRQSALELVSKPNAHSGYVQQLERQKYNIKSDQNRSKGSKETSHTKTDQDYEPEF